MLIELDRLQDAVESAERCYAVDTVGGCLGDWIEGAGRLLVDPLAELRPMDLCCIKVRPDGHGPWATEARRTQDFVNGLGKVFLGWRQLGDQRALLIGQFAPPVVCLIPESEIASVHRIIGSVDPVKEMSETDKAALELLALSSRRPPPCRARMITATIRSDRWRGGQAVAAGGCRL